MTHVQVKRELETYEWGDALDVKTKMESPNKHIISCQGPEDKTGFTCQKKVKLHFDRLCTCICAATFLIKMAFTIRTWGEIKDVTCNGMFKFKIQF